MSKPVTEFMNGGVVTSRAPSLLNPGELQRGDDCIYRDKDPAIWRAPGRTPLNSTALIAAGAVAVKGLKYLSFDKGRDSQLLAYASDRLWRAPLTASTLVTNGLTFQEVSGAGSVAGAITANTTFTATSGFPFTADSIGTIPVFIAATSTPNDVAPMVTAVTGADPGDATHFNKLTLSNSPTNQASCTIALDRGVVQSLANVTGGDPNTELIGGAFYGSSYFVWLGNGATYRLEWKSLSVQSSASAGTESLVMRGTGLDPVVDPFVLASLSGVDANGDAYAWPLSLGTGYYWFLLTEIYGYTNEKGVDIDVAEGSYLAQSAANPSALAGEPIAISVPALTNGVRLTTPVAGAVNNGSRNGRLATHWGVYMSAASTDASSKPDISTFRRVRREKIKSTTSGYGVSQIIDIADVNNNQGWIYPTAAVGGVTDGKQPFTAEAFMTGRPDTGRVGRSKSGAPSSSIDPNQADAASTLKTWLREDNGSALTLTGVWANRPIIGITIRIRGYAEDNYGNTKNAGYELYVISDGATKRSNLLLASGGFGTRTQTNYHGGPGNGLGVAWVSADFGTNFSIVVRKSGTGAKQELAVDSVGVFIHWSSGTVNRNGPAYRIVTYRDQIGTTASDPANFPNPLCNTGDFYQGSLVTNDLTDETLVRWSLPGNPEAVPRPYQIAFNTAKKDKVTFIRTLGSVILVGLEESIKRLNYLPSENDTDLTTGIAQEDVTIDHGIAGPQCAARFDMPGLGTLVIYASSVGMMLTNAITAWPVNDIDWPNLVKLSALSTSVVRVYPKEKLIAFYYCPAGATHSLNTRCMYFSYQADKIKDGSKLPMIGPVVVSARAACEAFVAGQSYLFTGNENNGKVYQEDFGTAVPSGYRVRLNDDSNNGDGKSTVQDVQIIPLIRTRKMFAATLDMDAYTEKIYLHFAAFGATVAVTSSSTLGSTLLTSGAAFGSVLPGYRIVPAANTGIDPETIVLSKADSSNLTMSRIANGTVATTSRSFDSGTVAISVRGSNLGEAVKGLRHHYVSTLVGDLVSVVTSNIRRGLELQIEKVPLTFDGNGDSATWADLGVNMRLHSFTLMLADSGLADTNRNAA